MSMLACGRHSLCLLVPITALTLTFPVSLRAQIGSISGPITQDTTWQGTVLISGTTTIDSGVTVTIMPGTKVKFKHYRGYREPDARLALRVKGTLIAEGTSTAPIYFTSDAPDPQNGDWSMLRLFTSPRQSRFRYAVFECAQHGLNVWNANPILAHCVFRWNNWEGIYFESYCTADLDTCLIVENGYNGLAAEQFNTLTLRYCEVRRSGTNGVHCDASTITVKDSWVRENGSSGLSVDDNGTLRALGVLAADNRYWGVTVGQGNNTLELGNCHISGNGAGAVSGLYQTVPYPLDPPITMSVGFAPDTSYALGYVPGDSLLDKYQYIYPDDETRRVVSKIGNGLGLTWSVAWDGSAIWCATLTGKVYKLNPVSGAVIKQFNSPGSQPWGMTFDGTSLWLVDFAEKRISKIDTATGAELKTFSTPDSAGGCKGVAWDGTYLNILGWTSPVIYRVDTTGTVAGTIYLQQGGGGGIAWDGTYFWVAGRSIQKYDLNGNAVGWIYPCSEGTWDMDWDGSRLWITQRTNENWRDAKIYRVEVLDDHSPPVSMYVKMGGNDLMDGLSGGQAKQHIQSAIDAAPENAIVRVAKGIYDENIILAGRTLIVEGGYDSVDWARDVGLHPAIVTGGGRGPVVRITGGMVTLGQLELRNGYAGIEGGAGLTLTGGVTDIRECVITHNVAAGQNEWGAGGVTLLDGVLTMSDCRVIDNETSGGAGGLRIGSGGRFAVSGTLIAGNAGRPAVHTNDAFGSFINCTVTDNASGGLLFATPTPGDTILNCILWRNGPYDVEGDAPAVSFTNGEQPLGGPGNISSDPLFVNPEGRDYRLRFGSPCIDSGDPASPHDPDATRADMGAYFYDHRVVGVDRSHDEEASADFSLAQNYPNPSNPATTIRYTVGDTRHVQLSVYDMLGREVATLVNEKKEPGKYEVPFDVSTMASGVYFYRLQSGGLVVTKKLVVLR